MPDFSTSGAKSSTGPRSRTGRCPRQKSATYTTGCMGSKPKSATTLIGSSLPDEGKRFLVFSNAILHLEVVQYSRHLDNCGLLLPSDPRMHASDVVLIEPRSNILSELR